jgi:hypothetical protein
MRLKSYKTDLSERLRDHEYAAQYSPKCWRKTTALLS